jgi:WD40 repeat protein
MDGRQIPGFYFDPVKKKYFKIEPNHKAPPNAAYSEGNVKKQRVKEQIAEEERRDFKRRKRETVVLRHAKNYFYQAYSEREIGYAKRNSMIKGTWGSACVRGWDSKMLLPPEGIRYFDQDPSSKTLYTNTGEHSVQCVYEDAKPTESRMHMLRAMNSTRPNFTPGYQRHIPQAIARMTSPVSSLHFLPRTAALCVTTIGSDRPPVVYLTDPDRDGPYVGEQFTPKNCSTIWCSRPKPVSFDGTSPPERNSIPENESDQIAVGAGSSLQLYTRSPSGPWDCQTIHIWASDVLALEWLDKNTISLGYRDGKVLIYDTRSGGSTKVLSHPAPICNIRRADDFTRLVVSGVSNSLMLYDMRHAAARNPIRPSKQRRKHGLSFHMKSTFVHRFNFYNQDTPDLGLDVHARLGLLAAADEDGNIQVWNIYTRELVKTFKDDGIIAKGAMAGKLKRRPDRIRCLKFIDNADNISLWAGVNGGITKFGW